MPALPVLPFGTGLGVHVGWQPLRYLFDMAFDQHVDDYITRARLGKAA
jgi:hypothetical protein